MEDVVHDSKDGRDFILDIFREDLASGRESSVATRFPTEQNGYLHIGCLL